MRRAFLASKVGGGPAQHSSSPTLYISFAAPSTNGFVGRWWRFRRNIAPIPKRCTVSVSSSPSSSSAPRWIDPLQLPEDFL
jgi:hypothetical protein